SACIRSSKGPIFYSWLHHPFVYGGAYAIPAIGSIRADQTLKQETKQSSITCGAGPDQNRIVSGTEATPTSWPFIVGFMRPGSGSVNCGGSLISETKILTAAHCFEQMSMLQLSQYVGFDIAIITMDSPVTYSKAISPVCLAPESGELDLYTGKKASVMGWGRTILSKGYTHRHVIVGSQKLMQTEVPIISNDECRQNMPSVVNIVNHMLCVSAAQSSTCQV
ncbi:Uncharacterized protein APZ42_012901, partial [Daphnia magna]